MVLLINRVVHVHKPMFIEFVLVTFHHFQVT